ncbi:MAG TPA: Calx-beta domain-containing protein [Gemmataceae bacterium]|nr:Calx-beta domain-containing protein [Gemmataceae bacterium]
MWFRTLFDALKPGRSRTPVQQARRGAARHRPAPRRLAVETLEDRCVPAATFSVSGAAMLEGNAGTQNALVTVTVSEPHPNSITVNYSTADGTATAGSDYTAVSGKLTFAKNETSKTILVPVRGDRVVESDEYFSVQLSNPTKGASIGNGTAVVTIIDNEPRIWISGASALEGNSGTTPFTFTVRLSAAYDMPVTVNYATADGTADSSDYVSASGTLTFEPGQPTSQTITVLVNGDRLFEQNETFHLNVSTPNSYAQINNAAGVGATIIDDEPRIGIADAYTYGDYSPFTFTVSLSAASDEVVTVDFTTVDGTALAGVDYVFASGTLTFEPGVTSMTITVDVLDPTYADNKYFTIQLSNASANARIDYEVATGWWSYYDYGSYGYDWGYYYDSYGYGY